MRQIYEKIARVLALGVSAVALSGAWSAAAHAENVIVFDESIITGEIEKPEAFYILSPSNLDYESMSLEDSFLDELYESTRAEEF
jgi:hypothetical protein